MASHRPLALILFVLSCGCATTQPVVEPLRMQQAPVADLQLVVKETQHCDILPGIQWHQVSFSRDASRIAYVVRRSGKQLVVVDGVEGPACDAVGWPGAVFSPDNQRVAYTARRGPKWLVVSDGIEGQEYDEVEQLTFSPDSKRLAYVARHVISKPGLWSLASSAEERFVVVDGVRGAGYRYARPGCDIAIRKLQFSSDSQHLLCKVNRWGGGVGCDQFSVLVVDGEEISDKDSWVGDATFIPQSDRVAYFASRKGNEFLFLDNRQSPIDGDPYWLSFSPDGKRSGYIVRRGNKKLVVIDGTDAQEYVAYNPTMKVLDNISVLASMGGPSQIVENGPLTDPIWSPDGSHYVYLVRYADKVYVVADGQISAPYDKVAGSEFSYRITGGKFTYFSPDSRHHAYFGKRAGRWFIAVDGVETPPLDAYYPRAVWWRLPVHLAFDGPSSVRALVCQKDRVVRLDIQIVEK